MTRAKRLARSVSAPAGRRGKPAAEAGADIAAIQQALGHRTPAMSTRYAKAAQLARTSPHRLPGVGLKMLPPGKDA